MGATQYERANVSARHKEFRVEDSTSDEWDKNYAKAKAGVDKGALMVALGARGVGKTQIGACCIGHCCYNLDKSALMVKAFDVFLSVRSSKNEKDAVATFLKPHLLVIDAFEVRGDTPFENRVMNHIIDVRYDAKKPTIVITNDTPTKFKETIGESVIDRMKDGGGVFWLKGDSLRGGK